MKLNLWMILNRLTEYEVEYHISSKTERTLIGALPIQALGCVYVYERGEDLICRCEQGDLLLHNISMEEGLLLIQSIFKWYADWQISLNKAIESLDFPRLAELCAFAFQNPVMIQDSNYALLGMETSGVDICNIPEWEYILTNGQSSLNFYNTMVHALKTPIARYKHGVCRFMTPIKLAHKSGETPLKGLNTSFSHRGADYGRIMVVEYNRVVNYGDISLLEYVSETVGLRLAAHLSKEHNQEMSHILIRLATGEPVEDHEVEYFNALICGEKKESGNDNRQIALLYMRFYEKTDSTSMESVGNCMINGFPLIYFTISDFGLLAVLYEANPKRQAEEIVDKLNEFGYEGKLQYGLSLPVSDIRELANCFDQAKYAMEKGMAPALNDFYSYASRYLLMEKNDQRRLSACEPHCRRLWKSERESLQTLAVYLREERSIANAAPQLFIHKNTLTYRIKYLKSLTSWNLEDSNLRDYLRLSLFFLAENEDS